MTEDQYFYQIYERVKCMSNNEHGTLNNGI